MSKPILLDGSAGTALWEMAEAAGVKKTHVWKYNIEHPEFVLKLHRRYVEAGSEMIQANTFDANRFSVCRASDYSVSEVISAAVGLAKKAVAGTDVKVYATFGPLSRLLEPYGNVSKQEAFEIYTEMAQAAKDAGADLIILETFMDVEMARIAASAVKRFDVPLICSMTFGKRHRTIMGDSVDKIVDTLTPIGIDGIGMNCSFGPVEALDIIKEFKDKTDLPLYFKPNSGMGEDYCAAQFAKEVEPSLDFVSYIGGCCGCDAEYIKEIKKLL